MSSFVRLKLDKLAELGRSIEERSRGKFYENWVNFWKNVMRDYRDVSLDVVKESRQSPLKTLSLVGTAVGLYYVSRHSPDEVSYRDAVCRHANNLLLVHESQQNTGSSAYIKFVEQCYNEGLVRVADFGLFSVAWLAKSSDECKLYENQCKYLRFRLSEYSDRILDFGFMNKWWIISKKMENYDVND